MAAGPSLKVAQQMPKPMMNLAIGIDLGGTNVKAALVDCATGRMVETRTAPTRDGEFDSGIPRFALTIRAIIEELETIGGLGKLAVGLSAPGLANPNGRCIDWMPGRMHGLEKFDWPTFLDREVRVLNDAHAALLGEAWVGAARGCRDAFMITLGTGVGGAVLSGGRLLKGAIGRAGHLGHVTVDAMGPPDACGTPGSLEDAIGNQTIHQRGEGRYADTHALVAAVRSGDGHAKEVWSASLQKLAAAITSLINILDPEVIIIGGGIASGAGDTLFVPLQTLLDPIEWQPGGYRVKILPAQLGDNAGAYGTVRNLLLDP